MAENPVTKSTPLLGRNHSAIGGIWSADRVADPRQKPGWRKSRLSTTCSLAPQSANTLGMAGMERMPVPYPSAKCLR